MNIQKYTSYFHDGDIIDINHENKTIIIFMESAEILEDENEDDIKLSNRNTIKGKLHLEGVKSLTEDGNPLNHFKLISDTGDIFRFKIKGSKVLLLIIPMNFPPKPPMENNQTITPHLFGHFQPIVFAEIT